VAHEQARLDGLAGVGELLGQHGADGELEVAVGADADLGAVGHRHPPALGEAVRPQLDARLVRDQARRGHGGIGRVEAAGLGQLGRERGAEWRRGLGDLVDSTGVVGEIQLAVLVLGEG
jgi:hypothetical protein